MWYKGVEQEKVRKKQVKPIFVWGLCIRSEMGEMYLYSEVFQVWIKGIVGKARDIEWIWIEDPFHQFVLCWGVVVMWGHRLCSFLNVNTGEWPELDLSKYRVQKVNKWYWSGWCFFETVWSWTVGRGCYGASPPRLHKEMIHVCRRCPYCTLDRV